MTVTYTHYVASSKGFGCFWKLLFRWRGSIYKLVWPNLVLYVLLYATCSVIYRVALDAPHRRVFEKIAVHCQQFTDLIPVAFVLGFYVSIVVQRWWEQYMSLPWPDALALFVSTCIAGQNARSRVMRRTIMRYVNLSFIITLSMISPRVKKRFPTLDHVLEAGFLTDSEKKIFDDLNRKTSHPKYWMPLVWAGAIVTRARKEGRIKDDFAVKTLIDEISKFRGMCGGLLSYDWISVPLVYTQVVTLAVYTFFIGTIMGRQFLDPEQMIANQTVDMYVPWFTFLQFFFYMGWLKVAESLVNPFGEDDDDFEVNWLIDRNLQVSYLIVDEMHEEHPELIQDVYWDEVFPQELPYTVAAEPYRRAAPQGSTFNMQVSEHEQMLLPLLEEETTDDGNHIKIKMAGHGSRDTVHSSASGLAMRSRRPSLGARKESVLSMLMGRVMSTAGEGGRRFSRLGSSMSMRRGRGMPRSGSHLSAASHGSHDSLVHGSSAGRLRGGHLLKGKTDDNDNMSSVTTPRLLRLGGRNAPEGGAGRRYGREVSLEEDGGIVIRIRPDRLTTVQLQRQSSRDSAPRSLTADPAYTPLDGTTASASAAPHAASPKLELTLNTSQKTLPTLGEGEPGEEVTSGEDDLPRVMSQDLGSDEDGDTGWISSPTTPESNPFLASGEDAEGSTGTVRRNRKVLPSVPENSPANIVYNGCVLPEDSSSEAALFPGSADNSRDCLSDCTQKQTADCTTTGSPARRNRHKLHSSPSIKGHTASPVLTSSEDLSVTCSPMGSRNVSSPIVIPSRCFSHVSTTSITLSKRFSSSREDGGPKSPSAISETSAFSKRSVSLEGLEEVDEDGSEHGDVVCHPCLKSESAPVSDRNGPEVVPVNNEVEAETHENNTKISTQENVDERSASPDPTEPFDIGRP